MCGISALYRYISISEEDISKLESMNDEMHYRGPDDNGVWHDNACVLAQVRLSIIGLQKGKQPLFNEDKSLVLICNGEIYNYVELKQNLFSKGHVFNSDSDSEVILHLYEEYGENLLQELRGMFAFCLWDTKKQTLFAARDRIGEKTLYYSEVPCGVVFSTELKAILKHFIPSPQINMEQLVAPIRYTAPTDNENTYIRQIKRLGPAEYIIVNKDGLKRYRYWRRHTLDLFQGTLEEAKRKTLDIFRESVDICLRSDVPVAVMLSGGIDSSAVAALAKETGRDVNVITAGYKGSFACDEREVAKRFAKERGFHYNEVELTKEDFNHCFEEFTQYIDEPVTDAAALAQWALYKKVKSLGYKVLLGGMGGDELFYGYPYWNDLSDSLFIRRYHESLFPWKGKTKKLEFLRFISKHWKEVLFAGYPLKIADSSICWWMKEDYDHFAADATCEYDGTKYYIRDMHQSFAFPNVPLGQELDAIYDFSFDSIMTRAYLYLSDREGMGNSLEIRSPMLDYKLVEWVSSLPVDMKYKKGCPKWFLKEILRGIVPDYILFAQKRGFTPPTSFIQDVVDNYDYKFFAATFKFYNSVLADRICDLLLKNREI